MKQDKLIRVIKRDQREQIERPAPAGTAGEEHGADDARKVRTVVSDWVREHRQHSDELWQTYVRHLKELGFRAPSALARGR